jgi:hypothetical protein
MSDEDGVAQKKLTPDEFVKKYMALCAECGYKLQPVPGFRPQIDGTFTVSVQLQVVEIKQA